jgi:uncharacterized protein YabE (DUF348 family)
MLRAEVADNAIEIRLSRSDLALLIVSALMLGVLLMLASWQVALVALGVSIAGTAVVGTAQRWGIRTARG